jgi:uncharacterized protein YbjT (DUF2867 family)
MTTVVTAFLPTGIGTVATGPVSRYLARLLRDKGERVRVVTSVRDMAGWPDGAEVIGGDATRPETLAAAFHDNDNCGCCPTSSTSQP